MPEVLLNPEYDLLSGLQAAKSLIAREQVASLSSFGVFHARKRFLELLDYDADGEEVPGWLWWWRYPSTKSPSTGNHHARRGQDDGGEFTSL